MKLNIPDKFPSAVRRYGNHFLDSLLCILNHNFYKNIRKGCYTSTKKAISEYQNSDFQISGFVISSRKNIQCWIPMINGLVSPIRKTRNMYSSLLRS